MRSRIRAATDVGNTPMAAAFARAGYATFERQIDMTGDDRTSVWCTLGQ